MKNLIQNGKMEMIRNHSKLDVIFKEGVPYAEIYDCWAAEVIEVQLDIESLESVEDYPYYISIDVFAIDTLSHATFRRYYKTFEEAEEDQQRFKVGEDYFDDMEIKAVTGPFEAEK